MLSKETFCKALELVLEQERIDNAFSDALQTVGNGHYVFGSPNKNYEALMLVLKEAVNDRYDYISWWLYEGAPDYEVSTADGTQTWVLKEPEALYDYIVTECQSQG